MRREVLREAIDRILHDLDESDLDTLVRNAVQSSNGEKGFNVDLSVVLDYTSRVKTYNDTEKLILEILGLEPAGNSSFWQRAISDFNVGQFYPIYGAINSVQTFLPRIAQLLAREFDHPTSFDSSSKTDSNGLDTQTVILTDEEGDLQSSPDRLIQVLQSISSMYSTIAEIMDISADPIAVVGMDSGSEKSFDFLGIASIIKEVRETLLVIYNTITFHQQNKAARNLSLVADSLPILERLRVLEEQTPRDAERYGRLRHSLLHSVEKFVDSGAYVPEMRKIGPTSPQLLMRPQPKLLTGPSAENSLPGEAIRRDTATALSDTIEPSSEEFSSEELRKAAQLLRAAAQEKEDKTTERGIRTRRKRPDKSSTSE